MDINKKITLSVISPVYKANEFVHVLVERIEKALATIPDLDDYEIILVEDCGNDGSWEKIESICQNNPRVVGAKLSRNFGQHPAITAGLSLASGEWAVVMDCDLQDPPEYIPQMWEKAKEGYDIVSCRRGKRKDPLFKRITASIFYLFFEFLSDLKYDPEVANFRLINRRVIDAFLEMKERTRSFGMQIHWLGFNTAFINITHAERYQGKSSYTWSKLFKLATDVIISYSNKPLRISIGLGFFIVLLSVFYTIYVLIKAIFFGVKVEGWVSIIISIWFLGGVIISNLGILGIYLGKIYDETKMRPIFVISKLVNFKKDVSS